MKILGFNRVEIIVAEDEIEKAVGQFNEAFGLHMPSPRAIEGVPVLSATDLDGGLEIVASVGGKGGFAEKLARGGPGQIGPLVWEIEEIEEARAWLGEHDYRIVFEYDSRPTVEKGETPVHQLVLDPSQWFGFSVTLMKRFPA